MKNNKFYLSVLILSIVLGFSAYGAPTMEGLFRNGNNPDLGGDMVLLTMMAEEIPADQPVTAEVQITDKSASLTSSTTTPTAPVTASLLPPRFFKMIFSIGKQDRAELLQVEFADSRMLDQSVLRTVSFTSFSRQIAESKSVEKSLFYSLLSMLVLNDSKTISQFLKIHGTGFVYNKEIINHDKVALLQKYKNYLQAIKNNPELKDQMESPLKPDELAQRLIVSEQINSGIFEKSDRVKLIREGNEFLWEVDLQSVKAYFTNEENRLQSISITGKDKNMEIHAGEYILFDGAHELPKTLILKDTLGRVFKIQILSLSHFNNTGDKLPQRADKYSELANQHKALLPKRTTTAEGFLY